MREVSKVTEKADYWREIPKSTRIWHECSIEISNIFDSWWMRLGDSKYKGRA